MAVIGTVNVKNFTTDKVEFTGDLLNLTISNGRIFMQIDGSYIAITLQRGKPYNLSFEGVEGLEEVTFIATFSDYVFNAGATDYIDGEGNRTTGTCVLSNQLQFLLID